MVAVTWAISITKLTIPNKLLLMRLTKRITPLNLRQPLPLNLRQPLNLHPLGRHRQKLLPRLNPTIHLPLPLLHPPLLTTHKQ
jgi:hypothetical protein